MMAAREDFQYTGSDLLVTNEGALRNYNGWIVEQFIAAGSAHGECRTVLDFGAGIGSLSELYHDKTSVRPAVLEVDPKQRDVLKNRGYEPFAALDEVSGSYDLIYTSNVLEHIEDDVAALRSLGALLNDDGRIAIFVPAFRLIWTSMDDKVGHHRRYTKRMLRDHLEAAGFHVENMSYRDSIGFLLALGFKVIGSKSGEPSARSLRLFDRFLLPVSRLIDLVTHPFLGKNVFAVARRAR
jgi:SAM-dependent methyltransferase